MNDCFGSSGDFGNSLNEETVPPYQKRDISNFSERSFVFVCFDLRTRTKPDEAELILKVAQAITNQL